MGISVLDGSNAAPRLSDLLHDAPEALRVGRLGEAQETC